MRSNKKKIFIILISLITLSILGCTNNSPYTLTDNEKIAKEDIESRGYKFIKSKGEIDKYILDKTKICGGTETIPYQQIWGVQSIKPDEYFEKEITTYEFIVNNHPLQEQDNNAKNGVQLYYMFADGKIIGGYSYPNKDVVGAISSLDGKTLEEVTGLDFSEWTEEWNDRYSKNR
ncbi:hypothetical protein R0131_07830 [Clostridium sp. AL.422]|uniref:hypothetical protein n=1 Tax=Clostridium TaxID=1485 RepID=UPI00293DDB0A|nr:MULTISPECIES: hypothetical protein [unclassified Clostridium]MDV4150745.1 hypothetical protein [Clostridium sp. AL.422]